MNELIPGFESPSCAGDGEHDGTACGERSTVGPMLHVPLANDGADHCSSPLNAGTDPAASSEPKRTRGTRTHGKRKPRHPRHLSVDFRSTGSSNLDRPAAQSVPTSYGPSSHKRQNDDNSGDGREKKKARYAELEIKVNGHMKELEDMKALLARSEEKKKAKESHHADSESLLATLALGPVPRIVLLRKVFTMRTTQ